MRLIFSNYDDVHNPYYGGGGALAIHEIAKRLARNHTVTVVTSRYVNARDETIDGVFYKRIGLWRFGPQLSQLIYQFCLPFYMQRLQFDIWIESFTPPFSTAFLQLFTQKPVVGLTHLLAAKDMSKKYRLPFYLIEKIGLRTYRYFIALTDQIKKQIILVNKNATIAVIPNGISAKQIHPKPHITDEYITFVGRIDIYQKGIDLLLQAFNLIKKEVQFKLVIAGSGNKQDISKLNTLIDDLDLSKYVQYIGEVSGEKKDILFRNSAFIVVPSRFEGFGIIILEALSYELPVVIFDIEDLAWVPQQFALKVKPYDIQEYAKTLLTLSNDINIRSSMMRTVKDFIRHYDWDTLADQYEAFLKKVQ